MTSIEDTAADGNAADGNMTDDNMEDSNVAMNGLGLIGQQLHHCKVLKTFFYDNARNIEWGGEDYNDTSLFNMPNSAEGSNTGSSDSTGMAARQEAEEACDYSNRNRLFISHCSHLFSNA